MIHYFNPGHETAVLNASPYYMAPSNVATMTRELAFLPAWYAQSKDLLYTETDIDPFYLSYVRDNLNLHIQTINEDSIGKYNNEEICLWGISPRSVYLFELLNITYNADLKIPKWKDEFTYLNSRRAAKECLSRLIDKEPLLSDNILPRFVNKIEDIEKILETSEIQILAKAPYSSSGRGLLWLPKEGLTRTERQILTGWLKKQGEVSLEQSLDKQTDFAMEFMSNGNSEVDFVGYSLFETNSKGAYLGNYIKSQDKIEALLNGLLSAGLLERIKSALIEVLPQMYGTYKGCIGVDMLIYKDADGSYKLQPCVEINMRYNMGYLTMMLAESYISPDSEGNFRIEFSSAEKDIFNKHQSMKEMYPAVFVDNKLQSGYLPLCPVLESSSYWAYVLVDSKNRLV